MRAERLLKRAVSLILLLTLCATGAFGDFLWFKIRNPYSIEDAAKATGEWIDKKSNEFDKKK